MIRLMGFTRARPYTVNTLHVSILLKQVRHNNIRISYIYYKFPFTRPQNTARSKNGSEGIVSRLARESDSESPGEKCSNNGARIQK